MYFIMTELMLISLIVHDALTSVKYFLRSTDCDGSDHLVTTHYTN